ncbi:MAG: hypothetical protein ACE5H4_14560 [Candidatus Thorarchaeota archaeon]
MSSEDNDKKVLEPVMIDNRTKSVVFISGVLVAISLVLTDFLVINFGSNQIVVLGVSLPINVIVSSLFVLSLVAGILIARAYRENSALTVIVYGGFWFTAVLFAYHTASPYGYPLIVLFPCALAIGGLGLGLYRVLQGDRGIDDLLMWVLLASTAINLLYFLVGGIP